MNSRPLHHATCVSMSIFCRMLSSHKQMPLYGLETLLSSKHIKGFLLIIQKIPTLKVLFSKIFLKIYKFFSLIFGLFFKFYIKFIIFSEKFFKILIQVISGWSRFYNSKVSFLFYIFEIYFEIPQIF